VSVTYDDAERSVGQRCVMLVTTLLIAPTSPLNNGVTWLP
jgi:hypothetical protein